MYLLFGRQSVLLLNTLHDPFSFAALLITVRIPFTVVVVVVGSLVLFYRTFRPWQTAGAIIEVFFRLSPLSDPSSGQLRLASDFHFAELSFPLHAIPQR